MFISGSEWSLKSCLLPLGWRGRPLETMLGSVQGGWAWLYPTDRKERRDVQKGLKQPRRDTSRSRAKTKRHTFYRHDNSYRSPDLSESGTFALRLVQLIQGTQCVGDKETLCINYFNSYQGKLETEDFQFYLRQIRGSHWVPTVSP